MAPGPVITHYALSLCPWSNNYLWAHGTTCQATITRLLIIPCLSIQYKVDGTTIRVQSVRGNRNPAHTFLGNYPREVAGGFNYSIRASQAPSPRVSSARQSSVGCHPSQHVCASRRNSAAAPPRRLAASGTRERHRMWRHPLARTPAGFWTRHGGGALCFSRSRGSCW